MQVITYTCELVIKISAYPVYMKEIADSNIIDISVQYSTVSTPSFIKGITDSNIIKINIYTFS